AARHGDLLARERELAEEHQAESVRREGAQTQLDRREAALQAQKVDQIEDERALTDAQGLLAERESARAAAQHEALVLHEREEGLDRRIGEIDGEIARASERLTELGLRQNELARSLASLESEEGATRGELAAQEAALARVEAVLKELRSEAQGSKQVALDL